MYNLLQNHYCKKWWAKRNEIKFFV